MNLILPREADCRRLDFVGGVPVWLADGDVWAIPKVVMRTWPDVVNGRLTLNLGWGIEPRPYDPEFSAAFEASVDAVLKAHSDESVSATELARIFAHHRAGLICENYLVSADQAEHLVWLGFNGDAAGLSGVRDAFQEMERLMAESAHRVSRTLPRDLRSYVEN